ncbi:MAG TPA: ATP-binding protein [Kineosporiaceae bacterium]|nr:ATP-binding protein [Kineosporiaceae bacterium]
MVDSHSHPQPAPSTDSAGPTGSVGTVSYVLPGDLSAVREARTLVQQVLGGWQADDICDDVALVASELVANALRHGMQLEQSRVRIPTRVPDPSVIEDGGVRISLVSTGSHVICAVTDPSQHPPLRRIADPMSGSGRGLQLVESLSLCWGWTVLDGAADGTSAGVAQGKSVWAMFPLDAANQPDRRAERQIVGAA